MSAKSPTLDQWRRLYERAVQIRKMAPWEWMEEIDVFGVQDPETGQTHFVSIMGMRGEHFAVALYPGVQALHDFLDVHDNPPFDRPERVMEIPQLQLSFESRDFLQDEDRQILKDLGLRFRGASAWPLFRKYAPGFFPWFIDADEVRLLLCALEQTLDVASRYREDPSLLYPEPEDLYLVRARAEDGWEDRYVPVPPPEPEEGEVHLDSFSLARFEKLPRTAHTVELDLFCLWSPVKEGESRPFYPYVLLLVDAASAAVVSFDMLTPIPSLEEMRDSAPLRVLEQFEKLGGLPARLRVRSQRLFSLLRPTAAALDLDLEQVDSLSALDQVRTHLLKAAKSGFDPSLISVDFGPVVEKVEDGKEWDEEKEDLEFFEEDGDAEEFYEEGDELDEEYDLEFAGSDLFDPVGSLGMVMRALGRDSLPTGQIDYRPALRDQTIDEGGPGTVLRDFAKLLEAIGPEGIPVTRASRLPKSRFMADLNAQLAHPIVLGLKRPLPKSYPNIGGLYLLLRAAGLGRIQDGDRLVLDQAALDSWNRLNPTGQYFNLLESWLLRGSPEILGEFASLFYSPLKQWLEFHLAIPGEGLQIAGDYDRYHFLNYTPGLPNLALMEIFGLLTLEHRQPEPGEGWRVERAERTPFGDAVLARLLDYLAIEWDQDADDQAPFGRLQPAFQPFFPEWRANLTLPETGFTEGIHVFKVSLGRIWRRIAAPADVPLDHLAAAILNAFKFDHDHLYKFTFENSFGLSVGVNHPYVEEPPFTDEILIGDLPLEPGNTMTFLYDFGDNWEFGVHLEQIDPPDRRRRKPVVLESRGKAPEQYPDWDG